MKLFHTISLILIAIASVTLLSCSKAESYSNLLRTEEKSVNKYLAQQKVSVTIPEDSILQYGEDAPYYKMNDDGTVYMKVINPGNMEIRAKKGDRIYFVCEYKNLNLWAGGSEIDWVGGATDITGKLSDTSFVYGNTILTSTTQYGTGIQVPMQFVGNESEVFLVLKAASGFASEQSSCTPYVMHVKYFKAEY